MQVSCTYILVFLKMRILTFILSIFVFAMAIMPCEDSMDSAVSENVLQAHFEEPLHDHSRNGKDGCTAFCICQCCGTSITIPSLYTFSDLNKIVLYSYLFHYSSYSSPYSFDYFNRVWHPPTLS